MTKAPMLISFVVLVVQILISAAPLSRASLNRIISAGLYLVHAACGAASVAIILENAESIPYSWTVKWFQFSERTIFHLSFSVEIWSSILWTLAGLYLFFEKYFKPIGEEANGKNILLSRSVVSFGLFLSIISGNFITFYFGWTIIGLGQFLGVALSKPKGMGVSESSSNESARLYITMLVCDLVLLLGVLGLTSELGYATFSEIKTNHGIGWFSVAVIFGLSSRLFLLPFLGLSRYLVSGGALLVPNILLGSVLVSGVFFSKMAGVNYGENATIAILSISCITALVAAIKALSESELSKIIGWLSAYFCVSVLSSCFSGGVVSVHYGVIGAFVALWLLYVANEFMPKSSFASRVLEVVSGIMLLAPPMTILGQARYFDYANIVSMAQNNPPLFGLVFLKAVADLLVAILGWKIIKGHYHEKRTSKAHINEAPWTQYAPAMALGLLGLSPVMGGRVFSGWLGEIEESALGGTMWLERLLQGTATNSALGSVDADLLIIVKFLCIGIFILAAMLALIWLERDHKASTESFKKWKSLARVVNADGAIDYVVWTFLVKKVFKPFAQTVTNIDQRTSHYFEVGTSIAVGSLSKLFKFIDGCLVDSIFLNAPHKAFTHISTAVRKMHNGGVIYMLGFALIVTALSLLRFYLIEGK